MSGGSVSDWEEIKARLEQAYTLSSMQHVQVRKADIRTVLEKVNDLENACMVHHDEVARLREENARLTQMMQRIAEDVLPDPVRYADLTPEMVRDAFIAYHMKAGATVDAAKGE